MKRKDLADALSVVSYAVSDQTVVEVFSCFCFTGKEVYAYNDAIAIVTPLKTPFKMAVRASTLMGLLTNSRAADVDLSVDNDDLKVKAGRNTSSLPVIDESKFVFDVPTLDDGALKLSFDERFLDGLKLCMLTTSRDGSLPSLNGVTIKTSKEGTHLYSCDSDAITKFRISDKGKSKGSRYILSNEFCDALLRVVSKTSTPSGKLSIDKEWVKAEIGSTTIYGLMVQVEEPVDHEVLIETTLNNEEPPFSQQPKGLLDALARARVVADAETKPTKAVIADGKLRLLTQSDLGDVKDTIKFAAPDVEAYVSSIAMQRSCKVSDELAILSNCTCYKRGDDLFIMIGNVDE